MISLSELRSRNVTPIWQEAVAVVQELIQTVKATTGSAELLPDLEHVALIPNGDVVALPGSPEPAVPVRHAAVMLKLLVDGIPAPPELEQFIGRNVAEPPQYDTVAEFSRNLAFFERPGRRSDVERLVARAFAAEQTSRAEEELKRLKERASEVTQVMAPPEFLQQQQKAKTVPIALVAGVGVLIIATGLWLWQRVRAPQAPAAAAAAVTPDAPAPAPAAVPAPAGDPVATPAATASGPAASQPAAAGTTPAGAPVAASAAAKPGQPPTEPAPSAPPQAGATGPRTLLERAGDAVRTAVNTLVGAPTTTPAMGTTDTKPSSETKMAAAPRPRPKPAPKAAPAVASATAPPPPAPPAPPAPVVAAPLPPEPMPAAVVIANDAPVEIFSAADPTVTPAVIVRPVLPRELPPGVPPEKVGNVELIVDEQGDVLHVKLISPGNRYQERMLVSAAKMWKFRPAYKDGRPVRYMTRVRLTL